VDPARRHRFGAGPTRDQAAPRTLKMGRATGHYGTTFVDRREDLMPSTSKKLVMAAMIFAVSMTFIDQTIVSIAIPKIERELHLSSVGVQWVVNAYLLALASFFAFGGRLADTVGHAKMVVIGVVVFALASVMCGLTPANSAAEAWIITFRVIQGLGAAIMYPASLAIVVSSFEVRERGRAIALFFGVAGGLTSIGPILGGYLSQWTWRSIFWVNVPVAIVALILMAKAKPTTETRPAPLDVRGLVLVVLGVGLSVFGLQQSQVWGWGNPATTGTIASGVALLVVFAFVELGRNQPLIQVRMFAIRAFLVENIVLFFSMACFLPIFFFASVYAQGALAFGPNKAGLYLLFFFFGFAPGVQIGGRVLDRTGAKQVVVIGCAVAAAGFAQWASRVTQLHLGTQWYFVLLSGFGLGLMVGPANTDALNQAGRLSYGEATGVTQTTRNFGGSLGLAALGTLFTSMIARRFTTDLVSHGVPRATATQIASAASRSQFGSTSGHNSAQALQVVHDSIAYGMRAVLFSMSAVMIVGFLAAVIGLRRGIHHAGDVADSQEASDTEPAEKREPAADTTS
jgi:EmrB/QacA subfamily drug resistance transporter